MKKTLLTISACLVLITGINAQVTKRVCGTMQHHEYLKQTRKNYEADLIQYDKVIDQYIKNKAVSKTAVATVTVPVVVHVVYANATQSISLAQAVSQVQVLNDDFAKLNADASKVTQPSFLAAQAGANIRFCMAQRDPSGNPTTGVDYKSTTVASFGTSDNVKHNSTGGVDAWDVTKYVNIWVCNIGGGILGYAEFPTASLSNTWGLVLQYNYTGSGGSAQAPYDLGRTGTHEFGHCFNLYHIWGDEAACAGSDQCSDTPNQGAEHYGCFPAGSVQTDACTTGGDGVMWMNYMDYTDDACMYMFTAQQVARMEAVVNTAPWNVLASSNGCVPVVLSALDASMLGVVSPVNGNSSCTNSVTTSVTIKNMGQTTLTSAIISYNMDGGATQTYTWTGSLASLATINVPLNSFTGLSAAAHTFSASISAPNNGVDGNATNNSATSTFTVTAPAAAGTGLPFTEGFESATFPPTGWALQKTNTLDATASWSRLANTTGLTAGSTAIAKMNNYANSIDITGQKDALRTPYLDFSTANTTLKLKFDVSHQKYSTADIDSLNIYVSKDCGGTWSRIYTKGGTQLQTITTVNTAAFTPTVGTQWRRDSISLASYAGQSGIYLKFESRSGWGNNLYLDNINVNYSTTVGLRELEASLPNVFITPNPSSGLFNLALSNVSINANTNISVVNAIGQTVATNINIKGITENQAIDLSNLPNGVYYMLIQSDNNKAITKKVVISK